MACQRSAANDKENMRNHTGATSTPKLNRHNDYPADRHGLGKGMDGFGSKQEEVQAMEMRLCDSWAREDELRFMEHEQHLSSSREKKARH